MGFEEAEHLIATEEKNARGNTKKWVKKIANKTYLEKNKNDGLLKEEGPFAYSIRLFEKEIITFYPKMLWVNDCGFFSTTTMQRLNSLLPRGFRFRGCTYYELKLKRPLG